MLWWGLAGKRNIWAIQFLSIQVVHFTLLRRAEDVSLFSKMLILSLITQQEVTRASDDAATCFNTYFRFR